MDVNKRKEWLNSLEQLISATATDLPADVRFAIQSARNSEDALSRSGIALNTIAGNIKLAAENIAPICQDTGMPTFEVTVPVGFDQLEMVDLIEQAIVNCTKLGKLRTNSVDSLTGQNRGDNLGPGTPVVHFRQWRHPHVEIKLILKGGGCENKNIQYSLPCDLEGLGKAGRNLDGVRKCILHAVYQAQGQGCSAGFLGVSIGGDRTTGYAQAKEQLFRPVYDTNENPDLAKLEDYIMRTANTLGIGTMGFGGEVTLLGCKIAAQNRLPASFFVSVAYNCWAFRRLGVVLDATSGEICSWLYRDIPSELKDSAPIPDFADAGAFALNGKEVRLTTPLTEDDVKALNVGDVVLLSGRLYTGRDAIHSHLVSNASPVDLAGAAIYHCGPVVLKEGDGSWKITAAGPTTSIREEPYQADLLRRFGLRAVIGKGGMGAKTLAALKDCGAVYLNAIGGAAQFYSRCIKGIDGVDFLEFGIPEAMWHLRVEDFPAIVTMDAHGNSLHANIDASSKEKLALLADPVFP